MSALVHRFDTLAEAERYAAENPGTVFWDHDGYDVEYDDVWRILDAESVELAIADPALPLLAPARPTFERLSGGIDDIGCGYTERVMVAPDGAEMPVELPREAFVVADKFLDHLDATLRWACELEMSERERHGRVAHRMLWGEDPSDWRLLTPGRREMYCRMAYVALDAHLAKQAEMLGKLKDAVATPGPATVAGSMAEASPLYRAAREAMLKEPTLEDRIRAVVPLTDGVVGRRSEGDPVWIINRFGNWTTGSGVELGRAAIVPDIGHPATQGVMMAKIREVYPGSYVYRGSQNGHWALVLRTDGPVHRMYSSAIHGEVLLQGLEHIAEAGE